MGASVDCELIGSGFFSQPVNTITTLPLIVAGVMVALRPRLVWVGAALIATGVGSLLFHGPMPPGSEWAHDVSLAWLIVTIGGLGETWERWTRLPALAALALAFWLFPVAADPAAAFLTVASLVFVLRRDHTLETLAPLGLIAVTAVVGRLGATGNPLCVPESWLQWHGLWHVGAAVGVAWWAFNAEATLSRSASSR